MAEQFDVLVLGGGTGGYVAAIRGAQLGLRVAVVERAKLGGTCLHQGCIPSKALLRSAEVYQTLRGAEAFGLSATEVSFDFAKVSERKEQIVAGLHQGVEQLLKRHEIRVFRGHGTLLPPSIFAPSGSVSVETAEGQELINPEQIIIATGSRPRPLPGLPFDGERVLSSDHALAQGRLPASAIIVGGGAIGVEWASLYSDFGVEVTLIEALPRLLPQEDEEVSRELTRAFEKRHIRVLTAAAIEATEVTEAGVQVTLVGGERLEAEQILVCIGREPVTDGFGLENFEQVGRGPGGTIAVDAFGQTGQPRLYAIGDVVGGGLAHVAARQGVIAIEHLAGKNPAPFNPLQVPRCTYSRPEVASIGLTEAAAREQGYEVKVGKFPFAAVGKARIVGETAGFVKLVADATSQDLLGVHVIGPQATDLIGSGAIAQLLDATPWELGQVIYPHPTLAEAFGEAALALLGQPINM